MEPETTVLSTQLTRFCRSALPWGGGGQVTGLTRLTDGWESEVYSFTVESADGRERRDLILRMFPGSVESDPAGKCAREYRILEKLGRLGYPVPRVYAIDAGGSGLGRPSFVMEKINGPTADALFLCSAPEARRGLVTMFAELLADLHALDARHFEPEAPLFALSNLDAGWSGPLRGWTERFSQPGFGPVIDWLERRAVSVGRRPPALIHLDFHANNILMQDGRPHVIDWTSAGLSDPRVDLAWTSLLMGGDEVWSLVRADYERKAGYAITDFDFFEVFACLRRLFSVSVSLTHGADKLGMRPGAEANMRQAMGQMGRIYQLLLDRCGVAIPEVEAMLPRA